MSPDQRRRAQQAERGKLHDLRPATRAGGVDFRTYRKGVTHRSGYQGEEGRDPAPPGAHRILQRHANDGEVRERVQQGKPECARPVPGPVVDRPENRYPADDEQRCRQDVAIREPGHGIARQERGRATPRALLRSRALR